MASQPTPITKMPVSDTTPSASSTQIKEDLATARDTLRLEANALMRQADEMNEEFSRILDLILSIKGKLIVSGMGKPGHIAKKIAATLASTGTPSYFVHPGEASHGDLGMISENDAVLCLSKSGESTELRDLINYCKRFGVPLIGMTANPMSSLGRQSDYLLQMTDAAEACPNQQAPTTSTTLQIALGDTLAVALMKRRGFSATDFRQYHPGGKLGGQLIAVGTIMHKGTELPVIKETATVNEAQKTMSEHNFGCAIVVNASGKLTGFFSDGDIRRHLSPTLGTSAVADIMTHDPLTIESDALSSAALALMNKHNITQLVVMENGAPVGLVRLHDILRAGVA